MTISIEIKRHHRAQRDPEIVFGMAWMWIICLGGTTIIVGFFPDILQILSPATAGLVLLAFVLSVIVFGQFGRGSMLEGAVETLHEQASNLGGRVRLVGASGELHRVILDSMKVHGKRRHFHTALRSGQCWSLHAFIVVCPLAFFLLLGVDRHTCALLVSGAMGYVLLQRIVVWSTYTIADRTLKIRRSSSVADDVIIATSATPITEVALAGARLDIDFCQDRAVVETDEQAVTIRLSELLCPHAFAAALIAATALPMPEKT